MAGRPPKFTKEEQIQELFNLYKKEAKDKGEMLTKVGFLIKLQISRPTYALLKDKKAFSNTIKKCENDIEQDWVQNLKGANATGTIFYLKNAFKEEYRDRNEHDLTTQGDKISFVWQKPS